MRPIPMKGHERHLTLLWYNRDGDLFSCAKDPDPTVWFSDNGKRLGTYRGHNGAVWCCDVSLKVLPWLEKYWLGFVLVLISTETGRLLKESDKETGRQKTITSLAKSSGGSHFLTGSLDKSAKVVSGGGQEASAVTRTDHCVGKLEAKFFGGKILYKILQEEMGGVKGHFGPINALAFNPYGRRFFKKK